jgi:hypothetical protein
VIDDLVSTLNWLAFTVPIIATGGVFSLLKKKRVPATLSGAAAFCTLALILACLFYFYRLTGFPCWMRWPNQWVGFYGTPLCK